MLYLCQAIIMRFRILNLGYNLKAALRWQGTILFTSQEYRPPPPDTHTGTRQWTSASQILRWHQIVVVDLKWKLDN